MKKTFIYAAAAALVLATAGCATTDPETTGKIDSWLRTICRWCL